MVDPRHTPLRPLPHVCYHTKFGRSRSNSTKIAGKIGPLMSRLSRSLKVIGTDTDRSATYDFKLLIHANHGPISYRLLDKKAMLVENR